MFLCNFLFNYEFSFLSGCCTKELFKMVLSHTFPEQIAMLTNKQNSKKTPNQPTKPRQTSSSVFFFSYNNLVKCCGIYSVCAFIFNNCLTT